MDIELQNKKLALIQWLASLNDSDILERINDIRKKENKDWWNELTNEEKSSIERGLKDAELGNVTPHTEVKKLYDKWL